MRVEVEKVEGRTNCEVDNSFGERGVPAKQDARVFYCSEWPGLRPEGKKQSILKVTWGPP